MHLLTIPASIHLETSNVIAAVLLIIGAGAFVGAYFKSRMGADTISLLKENNNALNDRVEILIKSDNEKTAQIAELKGQVETLKTVPLQRIDKSIGALTKAVELMSVYTQQHADQVTREADRIIQHIEAAQGKA